MGQLSDGEREYASTDHYVIHLSESVVRVLMHRSMSIEEQTAYNAVLTRIMTHEFRGVRRGVVLDAKHFTKQTAMHRKLAADWMAEHEALLKKTTMGVALVFDNALMRGALQAVLWMQPMPVPHRVFSTMEEAEGWVEGFYIEQQYAV